MGFVDKVVNALSIPFMLLFLLLVFIVEVILYPFRDKKLEEEYEKDELFSWG